MKICVLCPYPFPKGMAPATRMLAYCKGLVLNNVDTEVLCFFPKVREDKNPFVGEIDGVRWSYVQEKNYSIPRIANLLFERPKVIWKTIKRIKESHRCKRIDYALLSFDDPYLQLVFTLALRLIGIHVAFIGDEYPKQIRQLKNKVPQWDLFLFKLSHNLMACRILMTDNLINYYNKNVCFRPSYLLGSILDKDRFPNVNQSEGGDPYLCYMGNLLLAKDNVDNIVEAFSMIADDFPDIMLYLYGKSSDTDYMKVADLITQKEMEGRVVLKGRANYEEVPLILSKAKILVTSQPITKRAEGGFPTKMGEYMMTHVPMLVTDVGEIKNYVQDGISTYMVPPCDPQAYADKLRYILNHPEECHQVAERAYNFAVANFGCEEVTKGLVEFLSSIDETN